MVLAAFLANNPLGAIVAFGVILPAISEEMEIGSGPAGQIQAILILVSRQ